MARERGRLSGQLQGTSGDLARRSGWLLDLDGTLIDSSPGVILAFHAAQRAFGEKLSPPEDIRKRIGYPLADTVRALSKIEYGSFIQAFRSEAWATMHLHSTLLPGSRELLAWLSARNHCALVTSKRRDIAELILKHLGIADSLQVVVGSECAPETKPHPAPLFEAARQLSLSTEELIMVGDTQNDIQAARAAGLPVIALASGYDAPSLLVEADLVFDDAWSLLAHLGGTGPASKGHAGRPTVFTKHDCLLCDELKERLRCRHIRFDERDIRLRADWFERYRHRVPLVLLPDGQECDPPFLQTLLNDWGTVYR